MKRKEFIKLLGVVSLGEVALGAFLQSCVSANYYAKTSYDNAKIKILKTEFIKVENEKTTQRKYVLIKPDQYSFPICIFKISETNYSAVLMECTHNSCELHNQGDYLQCPCHGSEFNNQGQVQNPPAEQNLKTFTITTDNDSIYIHV